MFPAARAVRIKIPSGITVAGAGSTFWTAVSIRSEGHDYLTECGQVFGAQINGVHHTVELAPKLYASGDSTVAESLPRRGLAFAKIIDNERNGAVRLEGTDREMGGACTPIYIHCRTMLIVTGG